MSTPEERRQQAEFEHEVRRIARELWPEDRFGGAEMHSGRERDGVFRTPTAVHVVEATVSNRKENARSNAVKISSLLDELARQNPAVPVAGWYVTRQEPTADQRSVIHAHDKRITAVSIAAFKGRLVNGAQYLSLRDVVSFGGAGPLRLAAGEPATEHYVGLPISADGSQNTFSIGDIAKRVTEGGRFLLLGDFGAGKSTALREIYRKLSSDYRVEGKYRFPLALSLREHSGQTDPVEALYRHARSVGYANDHDLTRAWRLGLCHLLLDGFDEIASSGWAGKTKTLRVLRNNAVQMVRSLVLHSPPGTGILISGRSHYFNSDAEMIEALGATGFEIIRLHDLDHARAELFLKRLGVANSLPEWFPRRPLLLKYLVESELLKDLVALSSERDIAAAWDHLLERISEREARIEAGLDAQTVRRVIEELASRARASADGLGPLLPHEIRGVFHQVCGYDPDDHGEVLLQRLPGLERGRGDDGARHFVDRRLAAASAAGQVSRFVLNPFSDLPASESWYSTLNPTGYEVVAYQLGEFDLTAKQWTAALDRACSSPELATLAADVFLAMMSAGVGYVGTGAVINEVVVGDAITFDSDSADFSQVQFRHSVFAHIELGGDAEAGRLPTFVDCTLLEISGRANADDMPAGHFRDCTVDKHLDDGGSAHFAHLPIPGGLRVLLTILNKLFLRPGSGRRENAFSRGLEPKLRPFVAEVLAEVKRAGLAHPTRKGSETVWIADPSSETRRRVAQIIRSPVECGDELARTCAALSA